MVEVIVEDFAHDFSLLDTTREQKKIGMLETCEKSEHGNSPGLRTQQFDIFSRPTMAW